MDARSTTRGNDPDGRRHGECGPWLVVVHGGPGAPGQAAPLARELGRTHRVLEPFQRRSSAAGGKPLTVATHVVDLHAALARELPGERPAIVGASWGAMLALAYAAEHAGSVRALVLVGCGTFDEVARDELNRRLEARLAPSARAMLAGLESDPGDRDERLRAIASLVLPAYGHDVLPHDDETVAYDARGHAEAWRDMLRLQQNGTYPAAFARIDAPVLMLHGADDPHPGRLVRASLAPHLQRLDYVELACCGHEPWHERQASARFYEVLRGWLSAQGG